MKKLVAKRNPDTETFELVRNAVLENDGYCPCELQKVPDNKCPCKAFRNQDVPGPCHCGMYIKVEEDTEMKRIWDNYKVIGEVRKSGSTKFVIGAAIRDGVKYINIREFYIRKRDNVWMPGRDGITIPLVVPINKGTEHLTPYAEMTDLIHKAVAELETMPLADEASAVYVEKKETKV